MKEQPAFDRVKKEHLPTLKQYVPVVARVHGAHHPEFHEVQAIFNGILKKSKSKGSAKPDLTGEFARLREVTDHYAVPEDVCESYEAVYGMLSELDAAWHTELEQ